MSQINVNNIKNRAGTGAPTLGNGVVVTGVVTATTGAFSGNVSIGGTLTYEDVTNIDAVGVVTARTGIEVTAGGVNVTAGGINVTAGISTLTGDVSIGDSITHIGDNTSIRFPAADTFTVETGGTERVRVGAAGSVGIGTDDPESALHVVGSIPNAPTNFGVHIGAHSGYGIMQFSAATGGIIDFGESGVDSAGRIIYTHSDDTLKLQTANSEKLSITSTGGFHFSNAELIEKANIVANKLSAAPTINLDNGMIHHFTTTETTTATPNITSTAGINTNMAVGDAMSVTIVTTAASRWLRSNSYN